MKFSKIALMALPMLLVLTLTACNSKGKEKDRAAQNFKAEPGQSTPIHFAHLTMEFPTVTSGDTVKAVYPFKNVTNLPVMVTGALTSCPCMMTEFPKTNVLPGDVAEIKVNFATANQMGRHEKIIAVTLQGTNEPITLHLNGQINPK